MIQGRYVLRGTFSSGTYANPSKNAIGQDRGQSPDFSNMDSSIDGILDRELDEVNYWRNRVGWRDDDYGTEVAAEGLSNGQSGKTFLNMNVNLATIVNIIDAVMLIIAATIFFLVGRKIQKFIHKKSLSTKPLLSDYSGSKSKPTGRSRSRQRSRQKFRRSNSVGTTSFQKSTAREGYNLMSDEIPMHSGRDTVSLRGNGNGSKKMRSRSVPRPRYRLSGTTQEPVTNTKKDLLDLMEKHKLARSLSRSRFRSSGKIPEPVTNPRHDSIDSMEKSEFPRTLSGKSRHRSNGAIQESVSNLGQDSIDSIEKSELGRSLSRLRYRSSGTAQNPLTNPRQDVIDSLEKSDQSRGAVQKLVIDSRLDVMDSMEKSEIPEGI